MSNTKTLPAELEALVADVSAAVRASGLQNSDLAAADVRNWCYLMHLGDEAKEPRALQPAATMLAGILRGFCICSQLSYDQMMGFRDQIFRPSRPFQGEIKPLREITAE